MKVDLTYNCWTVCPLHLDRERCPCSCDYWKRRAALDRKVAAGLCAYAGCIFWHTPNAQLCDDHSLIIPSSP